MTCVRPGLPRQFLGAHGGIVRESRYHDRCLHEVIPLDVVNRIHVGMMRSGVILQAVLHELESRNTDGIKRSIIRSTHRPRRDSSCYVEIPERLKPGAEDWSHSQIVLEPNTADPARSIVEIVISRQILMFGFHYLGGDVGQMVAHIGLRTQQPFFFAAPQRDSNGAARLGAHRFENSHRFHHDSAASRIIGGARRTLVTVQMRTQKNSLVGQLASGEIRNHVEAVGFVLVVKLRLNVELHFYRGPSCRES